MWRTVFRRQKAFQIDDDNKTDPRVDCANTALKKRPADDVIFSECPALPKRQTREA